MNFTYENIGYNAYLVYTMDADEELDNMSLSMLTNNNITGIAKTSYAQEDAQRFIKYNVTSKLPASQILQGNVTKKRLMGLFSGIVNAMLAVDDYMLDATYLIVDKDNIYTDVSTGETVLIYLPVIRETSVPDLKTFFKEILFSIQLDASENCDYFAKLVNFINGSGSFSLPKFKELIDEINGKAAPQATSAPAAAPAQQPVAQAPSQPVAAPAQPVSAPVQPAKPAAPATQAKPATPAGMAIPGQAAGMAVPGKAAPVAKAAAPTQPAAPVPQLEPGEEIMTKFYLLQHYSKENKAIYDRQQAILKAQKEAAKNAGKPAKAAKEAPAKPVAPAQPAKPAAQAKPVAPAGMAIPGQPAAPAGMAIPGQSTVPAGMAIPGQPATAAKAAPAQPAKPAAPVATQQPVAATPVQSGNVEAMKQTESAGFGDAIDLSAMNNGATVILSDGMDDATVRTPYLIRLKNAERVLVNKATFVLGKEKSFVDYCVDNNPHVSRSHANIVTKGQEYFIVDTNSSNHTFVNGSMIPSMKEVKINTGDIITLGNEQFRFEVV